MRRLEQELMQLKARFCQRERAYETVVCERDTARADLSAALGREQVLTAQVRQLQADSLALRNELDRVVTVLGAKDERLQAMLRRLFGASRERFVPGQQIIAQVAQAVADLPDDADDERVLYALTPIVSAEQAPQQPSDKKEDRSRARPAGSGGRKPLPEDLPQVHSTYVPPPDHPALTNAERITVIGHTIIPQLDVSPVTFQVNNITCPIMRLQIAGCVMQTTVTPPAVITRGQVSDRALVATAIDACVDHLPLYRQEQRAGRCGLTLARSKLARWHRGLADHLLPIYDAQLEALFTEPVLGIDDSVMRRFDLAKPGGACAQGRIWAVTSPTFGYHYTATDTREACWISDLLRPYQGGILGDACSSHNDLIARPNILAYFCWAHARRRFFEAQPGPERDKIVSLIQQLYTIERDLTDVGENERCFQRQRRASPILAVIKHHLDTWQARSDILPTTGLGRAIRYCTKRWDGFVRYAHHGAALIDNNHTERGMRPNALNRKNSLFKASKHGAHSYAVLLSLCKSAMHCSLNPSEYLLEAVNAMHAKRDPALWIPARYARAHPEQAKAVKRPS